MADDRSVTADAGAAAQQLRVAKVVNITLWAAVVTQTMALPANIQVPLPAMLAGIALLLWRGDAVVHPLRMTAFALIFGLTAAQSAFGIAGGMSVPALGMLFILYVIFAIVIPVAPETYRLIAGNFRRLAGVIMGLVYLQFAVQLAGLPFPELYSILPDSMTFRGYNHIQPISYGSPYMKANGLFMLEASHCSQLLAMAVVVEVCFFRDVRRIALLLGAMVLTFSGTGVLVLLGTVPFLFRHIDRRLLGLAGAAMAPVLVLAFALGAFDYFIGRSMEFGMAGTSGNGRFIQPYVFMTNFAAENTHNLFLGLGLGNAGDIGGYGRTTVFSPIAKLVVELGVPLAVLWMAYIHTAILRSVAPLAVLVALLLQFNVMNGSLLVPVIVGYCYFLAGAYVPLSGRPAQDERPGLADPHPSMAGRLDAV